MKTELLALKKLFLNGRAAFYVSGWQRFANTRRNSFFLPYQADGYPAPPKSGAGFLAEKKSPGFNTQMEMAEFVAAAVP